MRMLGNTLTALLMMLWLSVCSLVANATIVEGNFKAKVLDIYRFEDSGILFSDVTVGQEITGEFWYDTALMNGGTYNDPNVATFWGDGNWLNVTYHIGDYSFDADQGPEAFTDIKELEQISIQKNDPDLWWDIRDMFLIDQSNKYGDPLSSDYQTRSASIMLLNGLDTTLDYVNIVQAFSLVAQNEWDFWGYLSVGVLDKSGSHFQSVNVKADIFEFNIAPRQRTNLPEPPAIIVFLLGLVLLGYRRQGRAKGKPSRY